MNKRKYFNSEKAVTLTILTIYIIVLSIVIGIFSIVGLYFYNNLTTIKEESTYLSEFDKFNSNMVSDVKSNKHVKIDKDNKVIIFEDGTTYKYNFKDKSIYRGNVRIAEKVANFDVILKNIVVNFVKKEIIKINISIGEKNTVTKTMEYTLKYW